jgi:hypothetical protein
LGVFKINSKITLLIIVLTLSLSLYVASVFTTDSNSPNQTSENFIVGYYINPSATPISEINFNDLKNAGITDVYVLVTNKTYQTVLPETKQKADAAGIRTNAWVYPSFGHVSEVAKMNVGVQLDMETYDMPSYLVQILEMRLDSLGETFSITVKPDGWDGNQYYYLLAPLCDYIVPQLYVGEYGAGINSLTNKVKNYNQIYNIYNIIFPGKIVAGLETYQSDKNVTVKDANTLQSEIKAVQPYTRGVILFRYGLSNFNGINSS